MSRPAATVGKTGQTFTCICGDEGTEWFSSNPLARVVWLHSGDNTPRCLTSSEAEARNASRDSTEAWAWL